MDRLAEVRRLGAAGVRHFHWDVSDGSLAVPGGVNVSEVRRLIASGQLPRSSGDVHLMVRRPLEQVERWSAIADVVTVHVESDSWREAVDAVRELGAQPAVAVAPTTALHALEGLPADVGVLLMSIAPGQAGAPFLPETFGRLARLQGRDLLGVDGGVGLEQARSSVARGANWIVSGGELCRAKNPREWIRRVRATASAPGHEC